MEQAVRRKGKIATWNDDKGFGFIEPYDGGSRVFIHIKGLGYRSRRPVEGDVVTFSVATDKDGRTHAVNATLAGDRIVPKAAGKASMPAIAFALLFLGVVGGSVVLNGLPVTVLYWFVGASLLTYFAYRRDKSAAKDGRWRTPESTLQLLALVGGWPGALIAQQTLRHKSSKSSFQVVFWFAVFLNLSAFVWLHTPYSEPLLRTLTSVQ